MQGAAGAGMGVHWMRTVCRAIEDDVWASRMVLSRGHSERSRGLSSVGCEGPGDTDAQTSNGSAALGAFRLQEDP